MPRFVSSQSSATDHKGIDSRPCTLAKLLELSARQEKEGQGDAHYKKMAGEHARVQPSKRRKPAVK